MATTASRAATDAHRLYVKSLYKRYLTNSLNWTVHRDVWREQAVEIRAEFDKYRYVCLTSLLSSGQDSMSSNPELLWRSVIKLIADGYIQ